jgi:sugar phosphate permease
LDIKIYRSVLGVAEASISVCCITTINHWFSVRERGTATGYYWGASKIGPVICPPIAVAILQAFGWRAIFQVFAVPVLLAAFIWYFFVQNRPEQSRYVSSSELGQIRSAKAPEGRRRRRFSVSVPTWLDKIIRLKPMPLIDSVGGVFRSWNLIGNTLATVFMVGIFNVFLAWIPSYLLNVKHFTLATSGLLSATLFAGAVAGNFAGGWISDNLLGLRRKPLMMVGALFTALALVGVIYSAANIVVTALLLLVTGFIVGVGYPHFTIYPMSLTTREIYPIAYGVLNTGAALGAACFPYIAGLILDAYSWSVLFMFLSGSALMCLFFLTTIEEPLVSSD